LWALVSPEQVITETQKIFVAPTGFVFEDIGMEYVNTFFIHAMVFHVFKEV
jgi:hypothetical protein